MCCYMDMRWLPYVAVFNLLTNSAIELKKMIQKMIHDAYHSAGKIFFFLPRNSFDMSR